MATNSYNFVPEPKLPKCCHEHCGCLPKKYKQLNTPLLMSAKEKGCLKGWHYFAKINEPSEDVWVTTQFLSAVVLFSFSAGFLFRGQKTRYDYARLTISTVFVVYAALDAIVRMIFRLASYCAYINSEDYSNPEAAESDATTKTITGATGATQGEDPETLETNIDDGDNNTPTIQNESKKDNTLTAMATREKVTLDYKSKCGGCLQFSSKFRFIIIDFFLYPLFICNLPKYAGGGSQDDLDFSYRKYDGTYMVVFCGIYLLLGYISRILVLSFSLWSILPQRKNRKTCCCTSQTLCQLRLCCSVKYCTLPSLLIHTLCQFMFQIVMLVMLWVIASSEFTSSASQGSGYFWGVVCLGYLCPVFGILSFFITDYYNTKDLLVTLLERSAEMQNSEYRLELIEQHSAVTTKPRLCFFWFFYTFYSIPLTCMAVTYCMLLCACVIFCTIVFTSAESAIGWATLLIFFLVWIAVINVRVLFVMLVCTVAFVVALVIVYLSVILLPVVLCIFYLRHNR